LRKKELSQRQLELKELNEIQRERYQEEYERAEALKAERRTDIDKRGTKTEKSGPLHPVASDAPAMSPILEKRLSGIEGKLDNVLKALEDLKGDLRR
jgi:hypothetical protein